jgi:hypothetical protein
MVYDRIYSASRSKAKTNQSNNNRRIRLRWATNDLDRLFKIYIRETTNLPTAASEFVRKTICPYCDYYPPDCEYSIDRNNRYYCYYLSKRYDGVVRLYLPIRKRRKPNPNSSHSRSNLANKIEKIIAAEPRIRRTRIRELISGKWETILDILENDLVFQERVIRREILERGKKVYLYEMNRSQSFPQFGHVISEEQNRRSRKTRSSSSCSTFSSKGVKA